MKKARIKYCYLDCGDNQTFFSLAALRCHYNTFLSEKEKREYNGYSVIAVRVDGTSDKLGVLLLQNHRWRLATFRLVRRSYPRPR